MATNIELNTKINTANSAQSLGEMRRSLKELIALQGQVGAGSAEFTKLSEAINKTEGRMGDLNDSFATLRGSGVERLNSSLGLLREGLTNADPEKVGIAFKGLGAAMSAVPIFLLVEGFKLLVDNFGAISKAVKDFTGLTSAEEIEVRKVTKAIEDEKSANKILFANLESQIQILEAQHTSESKILSVKKQLTEAKIHEDELDIQLQKAKIKDILLNDSLIEGLNRQAAAYFRVQGNNVAADALERKIAQDKKERIKEATEALKDDFIAIQQLRTKQTVEEIKSNEDTAKAAKKSSEDKKKAKEDLFNAFQKNLDDENNAEQKAQEQKDKEFEQRQQADEKEQERIAKFKEDLNNKEIQDYDKLLSEKKRLADEERALELAKQNAIFSISQQGVTALQGLSDFAFAVKAANTQKGTAEEEKAARKQFVINKGLQIANATISGAQGILQAATAPAGVPIPYDIPFRVAKAVGIGLTTAATIAKIAGTQFQSSGGGGASNIPTPSTSGSGGSVGSGATIPSNQPIKPFDFNKSTVGQIGQPGGSNTPNNTYAQVNPVVSVKEITRVANKVNATESLAKFG